MFFFKKIYVTYMELQILMIFFATFHDWNVKNLFHFWDLRFSKRKLV